MSRRSDCQLALTQEVERWSKMPWKELLCALQDTHDYQVDFVGKHYQVEVQLLENAEDYVQVSVAIEDGSFSMSIHPLSSSFVTQKNQY